jgi:hypothetical protein
VRRPITTLDFALLKDISVVFSAVRGPEVNSRVCSVGISEYEKSTLKVKKKYIKIQKIYYEKYIS